MDNKSSLLVMGQEDQESIKNNKKRILIVDDHPVVRQGLAYLINQQTDLMVCGEAENANQALNAIETLKPDLAIIDISLKGPNGIALIDSIKSKYNNFLVLVLSMFDESIYAELALKAGAKGYIMKIEAIEKILIAIRQVLGGEIYVSDEIASEMLYKFINDKSSKGSLSMACLSKREKEVFRLIGQGYGTQQIAEELYMGVKTVETHRAHIKKKLNIKHNSDLLKYSIKWFRSQTIM